MYGTSPLVGSPRDTTLLACCVAGSIAAHVLLLTVLPGLKKEKQSPPPLIVELLKPPEVEPLTPPKPLPVEKKPPPEPAKVKPEPQPQKPAPREERPVETPRQILTAPPDAPVSPAAPVIQVAPEPKPTPPPAVEAPRAQAAPVTPPRSDAAYLNNPRPAYPLAARRRGDQGTVLVRVLVTAEGMAASVALEKTSGHPALDDAALAAVKAWRFVPARQGAQAVEAPYVVPIVFKVE